MRDLDEIRADAAEALDCEQAWNFDPRVRGIGVQL